MMLRLRLTVAYVGSRLCGWQIQEYQTRQRPRTVQEELERVMAQVTGQKIRVHGAGRTDSGVHADGQIAHVDVPAICRADWMRAFAALLPPDIAVLKVEQVAPNFHARFDAVGKRYTYSLWLERPAVPPKLRPFVWPCGPVDLVAMDRAAGYLAGTMDYSSFRNSGGDVGGSAVRTVTAITRQPGEGPLLHWRFEADGFLKQMVRNLMGLMVSVGQGKLAADRVPELVAACDRQVLGTPTAPACGLTLSQVFYPDCNVGADSQ